jgi:hypothetical protein
MTTPEAILLTQLPIAVACFWVALELRRLRRYLERRLERRQADPGERAP